MRIRDYEQAAKDLEEIETIMREVDAVQYGLWTNGLEFFFVEKEQKRFETKCNPIGDWPMAEESVGTKEVISDAHTRIADNEIKITFAAATTTSMATRACPRMPPSGSSSI